jgi:hypothetical protein
MDIVGLSWISLSTMLSVEAVVLIELQIFLGDIFLVRKCVQVTLEVVLAG